MPKGIYTKTVIITNCKNCNKETSNPIFCSCACNNAFRAKLVKKEYSKKQKDNFRKNGCESWIKERKELFNKQGWNILFFEKSDLWNDDKILGVLNGLY